MNTQVREPEAEPRSREPEAQTFVETALKLGGKSEEEARKTGSLDRADDQVEALFAPRYQTATARSTGRSGTTSSRSTCSRPSRRRSRPSASRSWTTRSTSSAATATPARSSARTARSPRPSSTSWATPATGACWSTREYGGQGAPFAAFAPFLTRMATIEPTVAGLASVHGCIGAVDPLRTFGTPEQKRQLPAPAGQRRAALGVRADRAGRRLRPDRAADDGRARRRRLCRQRREAVHHQRGARPDDRPGLPDRRQAGGPDRRPARPRGRALPDRQVRPLRAASTRTTRAAVPRLPRPRARTCSGRRRATV